MTLDNMTGITKGSHTAGDTFCKSQLITCNRVKECNGVCPFEDALQHADKMQTMNEQQIINHDREWIIGCIEHDGFIHTDRFDKANQIIHDALSADAVEVVRCKDCKWWNKDDNYSYGYCMAMKHGYMSANWEIGIYRKYKGDFYCADGERAERREDGEA